MANGPLQGLKIIEIAGIGPGPFCAMMLADMGAQVIRIDRATSARAGIQPAATKDILNRGRRSLAIDLKSRDGVDLVLDLAAQADGLIEGFRPGVMERLGLGPDICQGRNPKLVFGRMTGWGQTGPWAHMAGHDINYIALAGALHTFGRKGDKPVPPINMIGDFGGGGMLLAFGMVCALLEAARSGRGQVVDAAMVDGSAVLMTMVHAFMAMGVWQDDRGVNMLDTGAHFYEVYETADGKFFSIGSIEPQFYAQLLEKTGLSDDAEFAAQMDSGNWDTLKIRLEAVFKTKTRAQWEAVFEGTDVCAAPVLSLTEAPNHPHNKARETFVQVDGTMQAAPAPRFSRTAPSLPGSAPSPGEHSRQVLGDWGFSEDRVDALLAAGAVVQA